MVQATLSWVMGHVFASVQPTTFNVFSPATRIHVTFSDGSCSFVWPDPKPSPLSRIYNALWCCNFQPIRKKSLLKSGKCSSYRKVDIVINSTTVRFVDTNTLIFYVQLLRIVVYIYMSFFICRLRNKMDLHRSLIQPQTLITVYIKIVFTQIKVCLVKNLWR